MPWLRTIDGLRWLMAASHGLRVSNTENSNDAVHELALGIVSYKIVGQQWKTAVSTPRHSYRE